MTNENQTPIPITLDKFKNALPPEGKAFAEIILDVAESVNLDPCILAAVIAKESNFGIALRDGCGDWMIRGRRFVGLNGMRTIEKQEEIPQGWAATEEKGPWAIPVDGLGWTRGLMQIDWGIHSQWIKASNWRDPRTNITFGASLLAQGLEVFAKAGIHDPRFGIAAYDAGVSRVLVSMRPDDKEYDPDIVTTGRNYSAKVLEQANAIRGSIAR